jgi:O-antigen/teichoic acid export membrane protein
MTPLMISQVRDKANTLWMQVIVTLRTPLLRNAYALLLGSATTSALGFLYWALAARFYDPGAVGLNSAGLSAMLFLSGVTQLSLSGVLVRFTSQAGAKTNRLVGVSYLVSILLAVPVCVIFYLGLDWWAPSLHFFLDSPFKLVLFIIATMSWSIFALQDSALTGLRQAIWVPLENTLYALAKIGLLIVFAALIPRYGVLVSWNVPVVLLIVPVNLLIFARLIPKQNINSTGKEISQLFRPVLEYIGGNYLGSLFFLAYTTLLPILVTEIAGSSANAYFYLPWIIMNSLQLVSTNMTMSLTVEAAREQDKMDAYGRRVLAHTLKLLSPIVLLILLGAPYILGLFGKDYAAGGVILLRLLALSILPHLIISLYISLARVKNRARGILLTQAALCFLVLSLSYLLLPVFGIDGVGIAWLTSYSLVAAFLLVTQLRTVLKTGEPG